MPNVSLTFAMNPYDRIQPLIQGEVKPEGVDLEYVGFPGGVDVFYDLLKFSRYDVAEMSFSSFLKARQQGWPYRMLPIYNNRQFYYTKMLVRRDAGIRQNHPEDLVGKRIGAADYQQSAALWVRGVLEHEFGVRPRDMIWYMERQPQFSHGGASHFAPPEGVEFHYATQDFGTMLLNGSLDVAATYVFNSSMDRPKADLFGNPNVMTMFDDPETEGLRFFEKYRVYPPQHTTVIRESIVQEHPWIARAILQAFERSKKIALERLYKAPPSLIAFAQPTIDRQRTVMGNDPYPYGLRANARAIDMVQTFSVEQGFTKFKQPWSEIFPEEVLVMEGVSSAQDVIGTATFPDPARQAVLA